MKKSLLAGASSYMWAVVAGSMMIAAVTQTSACYGQETATTESDTLTSEQETTLEATASADEEVTRTVVLLGEKVNLQDPESDKEPFPEYADLAKEILGGKIVDLTTHGLTIDATAGFVSEAVALKPDIAIVFSGYADAKTNTANDVVRAKLEQLALRLKTPGIRVFLVPSSPAVGTLSSANLRIAASNQDVSFIPIGTEVGGQPVRDALEAVREEIAAPASPNSQSAPTWVGTVSAGRIESPAETSSTKEAREEYTSKQTSIQEELARVAGESGEEAPNLTQMTTESLLAADPETSSTYPPGGTMTKRGKDAKEDINMRPLPPVKAYRPEVPVPRSEIDRKAPALSR